MIWTIASRMLGTHLSRRRLETTIYPYIYIKSVEVLPNIFMFFCWRANSLPQKKKKKKNAILNGSKCFCFKGGIRMECSLIWPDVGRIAHPADVLMNIWLIHMFHGNTDPTPCVVLAPGWLYEAHTDDIKQSPSESTDSGQSTSS